jgi:hypothetical protein
MKKLLLTVVAISLTAFVAFPQFLQAEALLNPPSRVNSNYRDLPFEYKCEVWGLSLTLYKLETIIEGDQRIELERRLAASLAASDIKFDLSHVGRKGYTRYYPFSINGRSFLGRVFLTSEKAFQERLEVLFEAASEERGVTFQILPGVNSILEGCKVRPHTITISSETDTSV